MAFIEAPTNFYLGRTYDPQRDKLGEDVVYYDSRDLTTHALVVGMTGSGKTGLCISILEEAILDNIPAVIIDPKGDITNLALTFPSLQPQEFQPWIHPDDARRAGVETDTYAANIAQTWRDGLQNWGIVPDRLTWLKHAAKISIYTPGSDAGLPISILASLRAPREDWRGREEAIRERINGVVTALYGLAGKNFEPVKDVEHVLLSNIIEHNWRQGRDLTLEDIVLQLQSPPFEKLGVFPVEQSISEKKRYQLAMEMNNIIASPSFQSWLQGEPLDMQRLLYQPNGRPRVSILYTAHLNDQERMFITTLLLETLISWMRTLSGTPSLRALLYIDEMYGYFPPYPKNPPTKDPLMRLLKQARAFGVGLILATQNPGDLDYKGLTNAGTWFIGRLQSENDKKKVMAGIQSLASTDEDLNLDDVDQMIANLKPRVFLMRNVHNSGGPILLHTRWAMSFLAGPLTRRQIGQLMHQQKQQLAQQMAQQQYAGQYAQRQPLQQGWNQAGAQYAPPPSAGNPYGGGGGTYGPPNMPPPPPPVSGGNTPYGGQQGGGYGPGGGYGAPPPPPDAPYGGPPPANNPYSPQTGGFHTQNMPPNAPQNTPPPNRGDSGLIRGNRLPGNLTQSKPPVSSSTNEFFLPVTLNHQQAVAQYEQQSGQRVGAAGPMRLAYRPVLLAQTSVRFSQKRARIFTARQYAFHIPDLQSSGLVHWEDHQASVVDARQITAEAAEGAVFEELPIGLTDASRLKSLEKELVDFLYNTARITIPHHSEFKLYGDPDKDPSDFQSQVYQLAREQRDKELDDTARKYGEMMDKLEDRLRRKERELEAEKLEIQDRKRESLFTTGEAVLSIFKGRTNYTLSRMSRANRYKRQTEEDIQESYEVIKDLEREIIELEEDFERKIAEINDKWARIANDIEDYMLTPYKKDIHVELFGVGWIPHYYIQAAGSALLVPAFG